MSSLLISPMDRLEEVGASLARQQEERVARRHGAACEERFNALLVQQRVKHQVQLANKAARAQARIRVRSLKLGLAELLGARKGFYRCDSGAGLADGGGGTTARPVRAS